MRSLCEQVPEVIPIGKRPNTEKFIWVSNFKDVVRSVKRSCDK